MADWVQLIALALIQGVTEFLPVSSSAHLILPTEILGWDDQGLLFDVGVHAGTLCAVLWHFRETLRSWAISVMPGSKVDRSEMWAVVVGTLPAVVAGLVFKDVIANDARAVPVIIATTVIFGVLLGWADHRAKRNKNTTAVVSARHALLIGLAQALALVPGTSRSGVTITAALFLGYHPASATRFSFLLSVPVIGGALLLMVASSTGDVGAIGLDKLIVAFVVSAVFAHVTIRGFLYLLERVGLLPFVVYRLLLGLLLWIWLTPGL
ncbi:MAG: undecaprenyl-diphosphate phosphatase [Halieaceae bacterium]